MWLLCSLLPKLFIFLVRGEKFFPAKEVASFMNKNELAFKKKKSERLKKGLLVWFSDIKIIWGNSEHDLLFLLSTTFSFCNRIWQYSTEAFGKAHNKQVVMVQKNCKEKTWMEITQKETIKYHYLNGKQQSSHTHFLAIITEWFPSTYIYYRDSYR